MSESYSDRVKCKSCENGSGPEGCTDCLNTGHDPAAFAGGIDAALNDAYAEGRKDERKDWARSVHDVLAERQRQVEQEGYTPEHDDEEHPHKALAHAAACYAIGARLFNGIDFWPWEAESWKPKDERRNLVRAAALALARIDQLDRRAQ